MPDKMQPKQFTENNQVLGLIRTLKEEHGDKQYSDVIDDEGHQYVDLVMEGGGMLGIALVGYTYVLEAMGIRFLGVGGTSAGSINALLVAALSDPAETSSEAIIEQIANKDFNDFVDGDNDAKDFVRVMVEGGSTFTMMTKGAQIIDNIRNDLGLNPGNAFLEWLEDVLQNAGIRSNEDLDQRLARVPKLIHRQDDPNWTPPTGRLALIAADISTETKVDFPRMAGLYWHTPDGVNPARFVRASMSIPFFFHPFRVDDIPTGAKASEMWDRFAGYRGNIPKACTFVDGGIVSNFPINMFHKSAKVPSRPTFGVKLGLDQREHEIEGPGGLLGAVFNSARNCLDYDFIRLHPDYKRLVTWIDTGDHHWLNFNPTSEQKIDLFVRGAKTAADFLAKFDWNGYKELRRQMAPAHAPTG